MGKKRRKKKAMTPEEFASRMQEIADKDTPYRDVEDVHSEMDVLMCNMLYSLGYSEGVIIFWDTPKSYA